MWGWDKVLGSSYLELYMTWLYILDETCHVDVLYQAIVTHRFQQRLLPTISVGHRGSVGGPLGDGVSGQPKAKPEV